MSSERTELGRGVVFSATHFEKYGKVAKFTTFPWCDLHNPKTEAGSLFLERMRNDHQIIQEYFGEEIIKGTHIVSTEKLWWVEQDYYPDSTPSSLHPQADALKCELENLAKKGKRMLSETGFSLDWHGVGMWGQMQKMLKDKSFWTFPSLTTVMCDNNPKLRIIDTGLLWTKVKNPGLLVLPHEYLAWKGNQIVLNMDRERVGVDFLS